MPFAPLIQTYHCETCQFICNKRTNNVKGNCSRYSNGALAVAKIEHSLSGPIFGEHWHEQLQFLYFKQGIVSIHCNTVVHTLSVGDVFAINGNELHYGTNISESSLYYILKIDLRSFFKDSREIIPYIAQLAENRLLFQNEIHQDAALSVLFEQVIAEVIHQETGYELAVNAGVYNIIAYMLRHYQQKLLPPSKHDGLTSNLEQLRPALTYLEQNYYNNIQLNTLANLANMSAQHFCRVFKKLTGKRPMEYIIALRINKAAVLLLENRFDINEVAVTVGFNDANYFSRVFKKYKMMTPSEFRQRQIAIASE